MSLIKVAKDSVIRALLGEKAVPNGLFEYHKYFRIYEPIRFRYERQDDGSYVAVSENFIYGSIITHARNLEDLDEKIKDAILTAFDIPSSYAKEADVKKITKEGYAFA